MIDPVIQYCPDCNVPVSGVDDAMVERRLANHAALRHPSFPAARPDPIRQAANALADARVRYAQEYARIRMLNPDWTDKRCLLAATEETKDEVTRLEAELEIARRMT